MLKRFLALVALPGLLGLWFGRPVVSADEAPLAVGKRVANFTLTDPRDQSRVSLADFKDKKATVVVFVGTECPINNLFLPRLAELHRQYGPLGVQFLAVNSNVQDTAPHVAEHAKKHNIPFPVLKDEGHVVADQFGAQRTPETFVLDAEGKVCYRGRIDDQFGFGYKRPQPTRRDLAEAIEQVLAGKSVVQATTPVAGCVIARAAKPRADSTVTFSKQVARILQQNCQECHRPGQIGPMALLTYKDAAAWSETIREVIQDKRMPPWHADPRHGKFLNDRSLSAADRDALLAWIEQGCPKGDDKDLPPPREFASGWIIGKPDLVLAMDREFRVPAETPPGGVRYQWFQVPTNFEEDVWIQAAEARPGNRAVVHHIIVYIMKVQAGRAQRQRTEDGIGEGFLVGYAPGDMPLVLPPGMAKKIPKGHSLLFQMHYTPNGTEQTDRSSVGLIFAKEPPKHEVRTRAIAQPKFAIPPGAGSHKVVSASTFQKDTLLLSFLPHMHLRGKSFEYRLVHADGKAEVPLSVPRYDFNWQSNYRLETPIRFPAGSRIECTAYFDNSADNPNNPDPTKTVYWGEQTWEEMMIGFVDYVMLGP
jgi:peroxiredoxin/mono/diheme cytochrome c family protein